MNRRRNPSPPMHVDEAKERCSCGRRAIFDWIQTSGNGVVSFYHCPAAPEGCGKAGPEHEGGLPESARAAVLWDEMRQREKAE